MTAGSWGNRFIFPAPEPSYGAQSYKRNLCWIPWNRVISPQRVDDAACVDGIPCLWFPAPKAATVLLFFHANAEDLGMSFAVLKHIRDQFKVNVMAVEYPGYGLLSHMTPSEDLVYEVALTAFRFLVDEISVRYSQIVLFGRSLGSGPATFLAAQYPVGGLILVSAFSSIRAAVQSIVGRLVAWTFNERFPNSKIIGNVSCSTLFIHGESDGLIPPEHSLRLFKRCRARKLLITPPKMEHNSNLFGDASYLAVPAIHFFGFPGYYTQTPPRLPAHLFESPASRARLREQANRETSLLGRNYFLCDCFGKGDAHHMEVAMCRQEQSMEDGTIHMLKSQEEQPKQQGRLEPKLAPVAPSQQGGEEKAAQGGQAQETQKPKSSPRPPQADGDLPQQEEPPMLASRSMSRAERPAATKAATMPSQGEAVRLVEPNNQDSNDAL